MGPRPGKRQDARAGTRQGSTAVAWARTTAIFVSAQPAGRPISLTDAQIAGISTAGHRELATRDTDDFSTVTGLALIDPFASRTLVTTLAQPRRSRRSCSRAWASGR